MVQSKKCKYDLKVKSGLVENRVFLGTTEKRVQIQNVVCMVESRKQEVRSGDLRVRVESVGCGVGACWSCVGGGEAASAAGPNTPPTTSQIPR